MYNYRVESTVLLEAFLKKSRLLLSKAELLPGAGGDGSTAILLIVAGPGRAALHVEILRAGSLPLSLHRDNDGGGGVGERGGRGSTPTARLTWFNLVNNQIISRRRPLIVGLAGEAESQRRLVITKQRRQRRLLQRLKIQGDGGGCCGGGWESEAESERLIDRAHLI